MDTRLATTARHARASRVLRASPLLVLAAAAALVLSSPASSAIVRGGETLTFDEVAYFWCTDEALRFTGTMIINYLGVESPTAPGPDFISRVRIVEGSAVGLETGRTYRFLSQAHSVYRTTTDGLTWVFETASGLLIGHGMDEKVQITIAFRQDGDDFREVIWQVRVSCAP